MALEALTLWLEAVPKAFVYIALPLGVGACSVRWFVLPRADLSSNQREERERRLARLASISFIVLVVALVVRLLAHTYAAFGSASLESLRVIALESGWGEGWRWQIVCGLAALVSALFIRARQRIGWVTTTVAAVACCFAMPMLGHAAESTARVLLHGVHLAGAGIWLGALSAIVIVGPRSALLSRFTPLALAGASLIVVAGAVMAVNYVGQVSNMWSTPYGRTLTLKLAFFAGVLGCGYLNWRRWGMLPSSHDAGRRSGEAGLAVVESTLALLILLVTAVLTELEHP
jgi:putative copper export protein